MVYGITLVYEETIYKFLLLIDRKLLLCVKMDK